MTTKELWLEYVAFLKKNVPASFRNLAPGATDKTILALEKKLGVKFPESVKVVWRLNDGQKETMLSDSEYATPCLPSMSFLSTERVAYVWKHWEGVRKSIGKKELVKMDSHQKSAVPGVVKPRYSSPTLIPLWADPTRADYIGLDFDPGEKGKVGQVINFGRNEDTHYVFATDFDDLLLFLLEEIRAGKWKADVLEQYDDETEEEKELPWFGDPDKNFYNTLRKRSESRSPKKPAPKKTAEKPKAPRERLRELDDKSRALTRESDFQAAYETILEAEKIDPKDISVLLGVSYLAVKLGHFAEADKRYATLIDVADDDLANRGSYFYRRIYNLVERLENRPLATELVAARLTRFPDDKELTKMLKALKAGRRLPD